MRLEILLPHLRTGGIEVGMVRLAPELVSRGCSVRFVLQQDSGELRQALPGNVPIVALNTDGMWATARAYAEHMCAHPVDVTYSATNALNVAQLLAGRMAGGHASRAVVGEHIPLNAFLSSRKRSWLRRWIMRLTYPRAAAVVAPTQNILDEHAALIGKTCPPRTVLPNPVVTGLTEPQPLAEQARKFLCLGRLSPEKGFDVALHMMAVYRTLDPASHLTLHGDGPEQGALQALSRALGVQDHVSMPGRTDDVAAALRAADVFVCTSEMEGFGNAIVEAQAAGVPVVSVDCPFGPRLLLQDGAAGCLVESRDPETLARALHQFASDKAARRGAQIAGQAVAQDYTVAASADAHAAFFHEIAGQRP